jgi:hypothetical protein
MSKSRIAMVAVATAVIVLSALPSRPAEAGFRLRVGPVGIARMAVGRVLGLARIRHAHMAVRGGRIRTAALGPQDLRSMEQAGQAGRTAMRAQLTAAAALAGWHGGRSREGWWRHLDGAYGWVGPLFWPLASDDLTDYVWLGDATAIWTYGYGDIYAAMFTPYAQGDLAAYLSPASSRRARRVPSVQQLCGEAAESTGVPIDRIAQIVQANEAQRAALDELSAAWTSAAETIRSSCPAEAQASGLDRLAAMQARIGAMIEAVDAVQPQLVRFYGMLDDDQKARLNALGGDSRAAAARRGKDSAKDPRMAACEAGRAPQDDLAAQRQYEQLVAQQWPVKDITASLNLNEVQSAAFDVVQDTTVNTMEPLSPCPPSNTLTPAARLTAAKARLETMLQSVRNVSEALDDFYFNLSDEQKAQFEQLGPRRGV